MDYANKYGNATLTPIGPTVHVSKICGEDVIDSGYGFDMDTAAKLALITENDRLQPAFNMTRKLAYVVLHHSPSDVQVCRLDALAYTGGDPHSTLNFLNKCQPPIF